MTWASMPPMALLWRSLKPAIVGSTSRVLLSCRAWTRADAGGHGDLQVAIEQHAEEMVAEHLVADVALATSCSCRARRAMSGSTINGSVEVGGVERSDRFHRPVRRSASGSDAGKAPIRAGLRHRRLAASAKSKIASRLATGG